MDLWFMEQYNRVAQSGCSIEKHALRTTERLEAVIGLTSFVAMRLFQLKLVGRNQPLASHLPNGSNEAKM